MTAVSVSLLAGRLRVLFMHTYTHTACSDAKGECALKHAHNVLPTMFMKTYFHIIQ